MWYLPPLWNTCIALISGWASGFRATFWKANLAQVCVTEKQTTGSLGGVEGSEVDTAISCNFHFLKSVDPSELVGACVFCSVRCTDAWVETLHCVSVSEGGRKCKEIPWNLRCFAICDVFSILWGGHVFEGSSWNLRKDWDAPHSPRIVLKWWEYQKQSLPMRWCLACHGEWVQMRSSKFFHTSLADTTSRLGRRTRFN